MTKVDEKVLVKTPVFDVVEKSFKEVDFKPVGLNAKNWVLVVVADDDPKGMGVDVPHLLVRQTRWGSEEQTIEFPCGTVEEADYENKETIEYIKKHGGIEDTSKNFIGAFSAAIREVKEETGIDISNEDDFWTISRGIHEFNPNPAYFNNTMTILCVKAKRPLKEIFEERKEQHLDKDEDCVAFIGKPFDYHNEIEKSAMGIIAINIWNLF